jgi:hypothetical protein
MGARRPEGLEQVRMRMPLGRHATVAWQLRSAGATLVSSEAVVSAAREEGQPTVLHEAPAESHGL